MRENVVQLTAEQASGPLLKALDAGIHEKCETKAAISAHLSQGTPAVVPPGFVGNEGARQASVTKVTDATFSNPTGEASGFGVYAALGMEVRRCQGCGEGMASSRYHRQFLRYVRLFRCDHCRHSLEQETRGFQGFYAGVVLSVLAPLFYACFKSSVATMVELGAILAVTMLALSPVFFNIQRYWREPVLAKPSGFFLLPSETGRTFIGRVIGGESRGLGLALGVVSALSVFVIFMSVGIIFARLFL